MATLFERFLTDDGFVWDLQGVRWTAQTFTPQEAHFITSVKLRMWRVGSPGTLTVAIRAVDGSNQPTGSDLASGTTDGDTLTTDIAGEMREIFFNPGFPLSAGVRYAIVARAPTGSPGNNVQVLVNSGGGYANGNVETSTNSGTTWVTRPDDAVFEDWGLAPGSGNVIHDPGGSFTRRMSGGRGGFLSYITPDGRTYPFHTPHNIGRWVISYSGFGTPPIEYVTERGPFQHGETVRDYFLRPRVIQLLIRQGFCDRVAWWGGRADLLNEIRPNRQATPTGVQPGELQLVETDGTLRSLNVWIQDGPRFEAREPNQWDEWAFQEVLRFIAYDPVAFDPTQAAAAFAVAVEADLVFPITFPIQFGTGILDETLAITYPGTWLSFPIITITGPIQDFRLDNNSTGEKIEFSIDIAAGRTVTIDLTEGNKTVVDDLGNNLLGTVTPDSDLGTWHLAPDPEAPLGVNTLRLRGTNPTGATAVTLAYFERYFGF